MQRRQRAANQQSVTLGNALNGPIKFLMGIKPLGGRIDLDNIIAAGLIN